MTLCVKQYIVVRKDLGMSRGKLMSQAAHASLASYWASQDTEAAAIWRTTLFTKIALAIESEEELLELQQICIEQNIPHALIKDQGLTELGGSQYTALGIGPILCDQSPVTHLPLYK